MVEPAVAFVLVVGGASRTHSFRSERRLGQQTEQSHPAETAAEPPQGLASRDELLVQ